MISVILRRKINHQYFSKNVLSARSFSNHKVYSCLIKLCSDARRPTDELEAKRYYGKLKFRSIPSYLHSSPKSLIYRSGPHESLLSSVRHVLPFLWPRDRLHRYRITAALTALLLAKLATVQTPLLLGYLVDILAQIDPANEIIGSNLLLSNLKKCIVPLSITTGYAASRILTSGLTETRNALFSRVSSAASSIVASNTFAHLHRLDIDILSTSKSGELTAVLSRGVRSITSLLNMFLFQVCPTILELSLVLGLLMYRLGPSVAGITSATMVVYIYFTTKITQKRTELRREMNQAEQRAGGIMQDTLTNAETIKYFNAEKYEKKRYAEYQQQIEDANVKVAESLAYLNFGQQLIFNIGLWSAMCITTIRASTGIIPVGHLAFVSGLLFQLALPLNSIGTAYREIRLNLVDLQKLNELLNMKPKCANPSVPLLYEFKKDLGPTIHFDNVSFAYPEDSSISKEIQNIAPSRPYISNANYQPEIFPTRNLDVIRGLSIRIDPGSKVGIVGPSGSGKSTLAKLLYRFYDPQSGTIMVDNHDLKQFDLSLYRSQIGIVPQEVLLFNESIYDNMRYGAHDASMDDIVKAAKSANLYDTIISLPDKFDTIVGERGVKLSGGQKQRLGVARCVLRNPHIFILDEATSSLDVQSEQEIFDCIEAVRDKKTIIMIAHRLSTVATCDKIFVIKNGSVLEEGTHHDLITRFNGFYRRLWLKQAKNISEV